MIILEKCARSSRVNSRTARTQEARACSFSFRFRCGRYTYGGSEYASPGPGTGGSGYYNHQAMTNYELSADYVDSTTTYDPRPTQTQVADTVAPDTPSAVTATGVLPSVVTTGEYSLHETPSIPHHFFLSFFLSSAKQKPTTLLIYLSIFFSLSLSLSHTLFRCPSLEKARESLTFTFSYTRCRVKFLERVKLRAKFSVAQEICRSSGASCALKRLRNVIVVDERLIRNKVAPPGCLSFLCHRWLEFCVLSACFQSNRFNRAPLSILVFITYFRTSLRNICKLAAILFRNFFRKLVKYSRDITRSSQLVQFIECKSLELDLLTCEWKSYSFSNSLDSRSRNDKNFPSPSFTFSDKRSVKSFKRRAYSRNHDANRSSHISRMCIFNFWSNAPRIWSTINWQTLAEPTAEFI